MNSCHIPPIKNNKSDYKIPDKLLLDYNKWKENFKWTIIYEEYIPQKSCKTEPFTKFLEHTIQILNKYEKYSWSEVLNKKNNHIVKSTQRIEAEKQIKHKLQIIGKDVEIYQIKGSSLKHRIFGYRENGIFHIIINDLNHKQTQ